MARKRRKDEHRDKDDKRHKKLKSSQAQDTNVVEILPAKIPPLLKQDDHPAQTGSESKQMTSKKRKRLEKYIENKLRKEEAANLIKKLAERHIDTSTLRSTKLIGQGRKTKMQQPHNDTNRDGSGTEDELSENSAIEDDTPDTVRVEGKRDGTLESSSQDAKLSTVGAALKSGFSNLGPSRKKQKSQNKVSWRERLEYSRKDAGGSEASVSESDTTASDDDDYSDWSGFGSEGDHANTVDEDTEHRDSFDSDDEPRPQNTDEVETANLSLAESNDGEDVHQRASQFKSWAREQSGFGLSQSNISSLPALPSAKTDPKPTPSKRFKGPESLSDGSKHAPAPYVRVKRQPSIQESRLSLPIVAEEQQIMEMLSEHDCLVICGETGSGKTTQIPQFLFEAGYGSPGSERSGMIGVTQPRRVAAVSMSSRVAEELGSEHRNRVGYQIRFDAKISGDTAIKFMTDGVLLREVAVDLLLSKYAAIIVDEAHERSVNTDVLIGVLSRVVKLRREMSSEKTSEIKPLKLIIMSATMRVTDFTQNGRLFPHPPPVINVDARQFPVTTHFNKRTAWSDYVDEAFKKIARIHQRLPAGGILVFLTGQDEIRLLCNKLRERFPDRSKSTLKVGDYENLHVRCSAKDMEVELEDVDIDQTEPEHVAESDEDYNGDSDTDEFEDQNETESSDPLYVLPLFSLLPVAEQLRVFQSPPERSRLCVVATNVAETSLTIPGIKYVVDCGRVKERVYDRGTGVESYQIGWISKASAAQRAGRAGRTGPGHCYRLYSSAVFERDLPQFSEPEILKYPIEGIVLQMKGMHIDKVINFPFPTPPDRGRLSEAEKLLEYLGALDKEHRITPLGQSMAAFPLVPRYSKMIILGQQFGNMPYIVAIVAGLSVGDPFLSYEESQGVMGSDEETQDGTREAESEASRSMRRKFEEARDQFTALDPGCDVLRLLCAIGAYESAGATDDFCQQKFLRVKIMKEIRKLRIQISNIVNNQLSGIVAPVEFTANLPPPSTLQIRTIKQTVAATYLDHIAIRSNLLDASSSKRTSESTHRVEYTPLASLFASTTADDKSKAVIHPNSAMAKLSIAPDYVVYSDLRESQHNARLRLLPLTDVAGREIEALAKGTPLINYSKPLNYPPPRIFSENGVMKKEVYVVPRFGVQGRGWELPSIKRVENLISP